MRREAGSATLALLFVGGCASVIDLQDRTLEAPEVFGSSSASSSSGTGASSSGETSASSSSSGGVVDAGGDAESFTACTSGTVIYESTKGTGEETIYRYATTPDADSDFSAGTPIFRTMPDGSPQATQPIYLLLNPSTGDYAVSPRTSEDQGNYGTVSTKSVLGNGYLKAWPGTLTLYRWVHDGAVPTRHRLMLTPDATGNWSYDNLAFVVCPPP